MEFIIADDVSTHLGIRDILFVMDSLQKIVSLVEPLRAHDPLAEMERALAELAESYIADRERRKAFAADVRRHVEEVVAEEVKETTDFGA